VCPVDAEIAPVDRQMSSVADIHFIGCRIFTFTDNSEGKRYLFCDAMNRQGANSIQLFPALRDLCTLEGCFRKLFRVEKVGGF
jgi:hypothetical protein